MSQPVTRIASQNSGEDKQIAASQSSAQVSLPSQGLWRSPTTNQGSSSPVIPVISALSPISDAGDGSLSHTRLSLKEQLKSMAGIKNSAEMMVQANSALEHQIDSAIESKEVAEARVAALLTEQSQMASTIERKDVEIRDLTSQNNDMEGQLEALKAQLRSETTAFAKALADTHADHETRIHRVISYKDTTEREVASLKEQLIKSADELAALNTVLADERTKFSTLHAQCMQMEKSKQSAEISNATAQEAIEVLQQKLDQALKAKGLLEKQVETQLDVIAGLKTAAETNVVSMLSVQSDMDMTIDKQSAEFKDLTRQAKSLQEQNKQLTQLKEAVEERLEQKQQAAQALSDKNIELQNRVTQLEEHISSISGGKAAAEAKLNSLLSVQQGVTEAAEIQSMQFDSLLDKVQALEASLQTMTEMKEAAESRASSLLAAQVNMNQFAEAQSAKIESLIRQVEEQNRTSSVANTAVEATVSVLHRENLEYRALLDTLERSIAAKSAECTALQRRVETLEEQTRGLKALKEAAETRVQSMFIMQKQLQRQCEMQSDETSSLAQQVVGLEGQIKMLTYERENSEAAFGYELDILHRRLEAETAALQAARAEASAQASRLEREEARYESERAVLSGRSRKLEGDLEGLGRERERAVAAEVRFKEGLAARYWGRWVAREMWKAWAGRAGRRAEAGRRGRRAIARLGACAVEDAWERWAAGRGPAAAELKGRRAIRYWIVRCCRWWLGAWRIRCRWRTRVVSIVDKVRWRVCVGCTGRAWARWVRYARRKRVVSRRVARWGSCRQGRARREVWDTWCSAARRGAWAWRVAGAARSRCVLSRFSGAFAALAGRAVRSRVWRRQAKHVARRRCGGVLRAWAERARAGACVRRLGRRAEVRGLVACEARAFVKIARWAEHARGAGRKLAVSARYRDVLRGWAERARVRARVRRLGRRVELRGLVACEARAFRKIARWAEHVRGAGRKLAVSARYWTRECSRKVWTSWALYRQLRARMRALLSKARSKIGCMPRCFLEWEEYTRSMAAEKDIGRLVEMIKAHNFAAAAASILRGGLQDNSDIRSAIVEVIRVSLEDLRKKAILVSEEICTDEAKQIADEARLLMECKSLFGSMTDWQVQGFDQDLESTSQIIIGKITKQLERIEHVMERGNFPKADALISKVETVVHMLGEPLCPRLVAERVRAVQQSLLTRFESRVERIMNLDVDQYVNEPPAAFFSFFDDTQTRPENGGEVVVVDEKYRVKLDRLKTGILARVQKAVAQIPLQDAEDVVLPKIEETLSFVPADLRKALESTVKQKANEIRHNKEEEADRLETELRARDHAAIQRRLETASRAQVQRMRDRILDYLRQEMGALLAISEPEALSLRGPDLKKTCMFCEHIKTIVVEVKPMLIEIQRVLEQGGRQASVSLKETFVNFGKSALLDEVRLAERRYATAVALRDISIDLSSLTTNAEISSQGHLQTFAEMQEFVFNQHDALVDRFRTSVEKWEWPSVSNILDQLRLWDPFLKSVKRTPESQSNAAPVASRECYSSMVELAKSAIPLAVAELKQVELINDRTGAGREPKVRDEFYRQLEAQLESLGRVTLLSDHVPNLLQMSVDALYETHVLPKAKRLFEEAQSICEKRIISPADFDRFNLIFVNLDALCRLLRASSSSSAGGGGGFRLAALDELILSRVEDLKEKMLAAPQVNDIDAVAASLLEMKAVANGVYHLAKEINGRIDAALGRYRTALGGNMAIAKLATILNRLGHVGQDLIQEHSCFVGYQIHLFNGKTQQQDIHYVLQFIQGDNVDTDALMRRFVEFDNKYKALVKQYLQPDPRSFTDLAAATLAAAAGLTAIPAAATATNGATGRAPPPPPPAAAVPALAAAATPEFVWDRRRRDAVPGLAAHLFAMWTIHHSASFFSSSDAHDHDTYLLKPHAAQVIAIFRLFGLDAAGDDDDAPPPAGGGGSGGGGGPLERNLVQIGTGEGKSVTLAVTAAVFALFGAEVATACYSEYLSGRDHEAFRFLFRALGVDGLVHYGTFNTLCEREINKWGQIRDIAERMIRQPPAPSDYRAAGGGFAAAMTASARGAAAAAPATAAAAAAAAACGRVLLIDEVDVFFSEHFYGSVYTPSCSLSQPAITDLIMHVWRNRHSSDLCERSVLQSAEFQACCRALPGWEFLVEAAVGDMIEDVTTFEGQEYVVQQDRIGYKEQDGIAFNVSYGYKTTFAYLQERERGTISDASLARSMAVSVRCGSFSYAEVPKLFDTVIGLTGTLATLSPAQNAIIEGEYGISKRTYMPSVFGRSNLSFRPGADVRVEPDDEYSLALAAEVVAARRAGRAVLIFFPSKERLYDFRQSPPFAALRDEALVLTEETPTAEKGSLIKRATTTGTVALLTRDYGRGTDFVCRDPAVAAAGGVHVIQTFLSLEVAEETQIRGRTARQGERGSYCLLLREADLVTSPGVTREEVTAHRARGDVYELLDGRRREAFQAGYAESTAHVHALEASHAAAVANLRSMLAGDVPAVRAFLEEHNFARLAAAAAESSAAGGRGSGGGGRGAKSRTVLLIDATRSMNHLMQKAKMTVTAMFDRASAVLAEEGVVGAAFEMQVAVYRNYNSSADGLLEWSSWETDPQQLRRFLESVVVQGGWDNEAVEVALWHVNREARRGRISQAILIGDAPGNTRDDVLSKRAQKGEEYWAATRFHKPTHVDAEVEALAARGVPVHGFYIAERARRCFRAVADATGGTCARLDINSTGGADLLTDMVTEEILRSVAAAVGGGSDEGERLVQAYRAKFCKAYT